MPQFVQVKNNTVTPPMVSKMEVKIAEDWVRRHDADPKTKGHYEILAPVKVQVPTVQREEKKSPVVVVEPELAGAKLTLPIVEKKPKK